MSEWQVEYDDDFAHWYRGQRTKPAIALGIGVVSWCAGAIAGHADIGTVLGLLFLGYSLIRRIWLDYKLKESYECKECGKRLSFSEPEDTCEIRYFCFDCRVEFRVRA